MGDECKIMRPRAPRAGHKWETSVRACGPKHPEWNASPETKGTQPFERSKNPVQVNLFGEWCLGNIFKGSLSLEVLTSDYIESCRQVLQHRCLTAKIFCSRCVTGETGR